MSHAQRILALAIVGAGVFGAAKAHATITPIPGGSSTDAFFGSQGTAYQDSAPSVSFPFATPGGPYPAGVGLSLPGGVPNAPVVASYPSTLGGYNFNAGGYTFNFTDSLPPATGTYATTTIDHFFLPGGTSTSDVEILFPNWRMAQGPSAPSYAYEQVRFISQYMVNTPLSASTPSFNLFFNGSNSGLGTPFAQFDASVNYWWIPTNSTGGVIGPPTLLGTLNYSWLSSGSGPFFGAASSTGSLIASPTSQGVLELSGYAYMAGDPFEMTVSSLPEPASLSILGIGAAALLLKRRRA